MNALVFPAAMSGCVRTVKKKERKKIDSFGMWCWRQMLKIPRTTRRTNKSVLEKNWTTLYTRSTDAKPETHTLDTSWVEKNKSLETSTMLGMVEGRRGRSRPCMCWMDGVKGESKLSLPELR